MTHYEVLEVKTTATADELAEAYHRLARRWHPDRHMQEPPAVREAAAAHMRAVNAAWEVLGDPVARLAYDGRIRSHEVDARGAGEPTHRLPEDHFQRLGFGRGGGPGGASWWFGRPLYLQVADATDLRALLVLAPDGLWGLNGYGSFIADDDLAVLTPLTGLRHLDLGATAVTDAGLVHLLSMARMDDLSLAGTAVTDAGVAVLGELGRLTHLNLADTAVTDAVVDTLARWTGMAVLNLRGTTISAASTERLIGLLPKLHTFGLPAIGWRAVNRLRQLHPRLID